MGQEKRKREGRGQGGGVRGNARGSRPCGGGQRARSLGHQRSEPGQGDRDEDTSQTPGEAQGADPLSPENPIVFVVGPLTGLFPLASKTVAMFKSPHTGNLGESHAGGRSAVAIRTAGYGAIVIRGANDIPRYVAIHGSEVYGLDAMSTGVVSA